MPTVVLWGTTRWARPTLRGMLLFDASENVTHIGLRAQFPLLFGIPLDRIAHFVRGLSFWIIKVGEPRKSRIPDDDIRINGPRM